MQMKRSWITSAPPSLKNAGVTAALVLVVAPLAACDIAFDPADEPEVPEVPEVPDVPDVEPDDVAAELEEAIFEKLQCEEILRPSTLERMRALLRDPTFEELEALLTNPQDLATVVAMAGVEVEGAIVVARNIERLVSNGTAQQLVDGGWDGVQCGEPVEFACTAGDETTTVACDVDTLVTSVATDFALCTLGGTVHDGAMTFDRIEGVDTSARVTFAALAFDEIKVLDGSIAVALQPADGTIFSATLGDGLAYTEHGGPDGGVSCGARLSLDALELDVNDAESSIEFAGARATADGDQLDIETTDALRFPTGTRCACPLAGGGVRVEVPRPLGREGESATAQIEFTPTSDAALCAEASVTLSSWPSTCDLGGDCAKGATETTLGKLVSALCTEVPG